MKKQWILAALMLSCIGVNAQTKMPADSTAPKKVAAPVEKKGILRTEERSIEGGVHTGGWSVGYNTGIAETYYKTNFWHFALSEIKDPRETLSSLDGGGAQGFQPRPFIYAKQNSFFQLQVGRGTKRQLSDKAETRGVLVGYSFTYGATLGIIKPYYVDILKPITGGGGGGYTTKSIRYTEETSTEFLFGYIYGASSFTKGIDEMSVTPGAFGRIGLNLDWLTNDEENVWSLQAGLRTDIFPTKVPIMVNVTPIDQNKFIYFNLYAILQIGKRY